MADVSDAFERTVVDGWGTADIGGSWSTVGTAADYDVDSGVGKHSVGVVNVSYRTHIGSLKNARIRVKCRPMFDPSGGSIWISLLARYVDANNHYIFRLRIQPINADPAQIMIQKQVGGVLSTVVAEANITGNPQSGAGSAWWWIDAEMDASTLRMKAFRDVDSDPGFYQLVGTDTDLTAAGGVGVRTLASATMSNTLPVTVEYDDFTARSLNPAIPDLLAPTVTLYTPSIKVSSKALPSLLVPTVTVPTPVVGNVSRVLPESLLATMDTYDAQGSKDEFAVPSAISVSGAPIAPTAKASSVALPAGLSINGAPPDAVGSIKADKAAPDTTIALGSVGAPTLRVSEFVTPPVVACTGTITTPTIGLTQKVTTTTVVAASTITTPTGRAADKVIPTTLAATGVPSNAKGSTRHRATPSVLANTSTTYNAAGSESSETTPAVVLATSTVYGTDIVRTSSVAMPDVLYVIGYPYTAQPIAGDPIELDGLEQVRFTRVSSPTPYIIGSDGIQYGRVKISRA